MTQINDISIENDGIPITVQINSKNYDIDELQSIKLKSNSLSFLHLNITSINYHIDDLKTLIALSGIDWDIIGISESGLKKENKSISNISIQNYHERSVNSL